MRNIPMNFFSPESPHVIFRFTPLLCLSNLFNVPHTSANSPAVSAKIFMKITTDMANVYSPYLENFQKYNSRSVQFYLNSENKNLEIVSLKGCQTSVEYSFSAYQ